MKSLIAAAMLLALTFPAHGAFLASAWESSRDVLNWLKTTSVWREITRRD